MTLIYQLPIAVSLSQVFSTVQGSQYIVLVDENTNAYCYTKIEDRLPKHAVIKVAAGEHHKNLQTCQYIWQALTKLGADRKAVLINLGGGVITDMGGFCAATYKRGIRFINIPTTLLAQVDASVGSKTGVDFGPLKNHIGLFAEATAVLVDPSFLTTLPERELRSGYAEVIKHALIADADYWKLIQETNWKQHNWCSIVAQSIRIKQEVVAQDPTEQGLRKVLNFGHSLGHALESTCLNTENHLLHGEAIAIGMQCEAYIAKTKNLITEKQLEEIILYIGSIWPAYTISDTVIASSLRLLVQDKKNEAGALLFSLISGIGSCEFNTAVHSIEAKEALRWYQQK